MSDLRHDRQRMVDALAPSIPTPQVARDDGAFQVSWLVGGTCVMLWLDEEDAILQADIDRDVIWSYQIEADWTPDDVAFRVARELLSVMALNVRHPVPW